MGKRYDALIVGGGVIGCSIAYHLAKVGKDVLLVEKDRIGSQASSAAAGMLGVQAELEEDGPLFQLARKSRDMFPNLAQELREITGIDIALIKSGALKPAFTNEQLESFEQTASWQTQNGEKAIMLNKDDVLTKEPALTDDVKGALYFPNEAQVSPVDLTHALVKGAQYYGAKIREFTDVLSLHIEDQEIKGVDTVAGTFLAEAVIIASGAWSKQWFRHQPHVDIYPVKGEALCVETSTPLLTTTIFSKDCYITPKKGHDIYIGATMTPYDFSKSVSVNGLSSLLEKAQRLLPSLADADVKQVWSGLRPMTNDGLPFIGKDTQLENLFYATGHYRNGILLSPITGLITARLITEGYENIDLLTPFQYDRLKEVNRREYQVKW
ncbi:glycine oxidase [Scopulibacillus darangshiensis]|uniref:glycine oxidase n=1 Tax=Scopulibacillus darangshiensis TaxID=442528 RepID=A0A4R2PCD7_9BACL|nr:glycine oxidase ThiO [Scopulibacillus darangshiensis]TCP32068.1 glycine oxidase [Scopulibacillus darangshiensis]